MTETIERPWGKIVVYDDGSTQSIIKKRREFAQDEDFSLSPDSLVGSAFHVLADRRMVWQGVVVAEPQPGRYLCEIDVLEQHAEKVQRIFSLDTLMGLGDEARRLIEGGMSQASAPIIDPYLEWRLYDSEEAAAKAFVAWVQHEQERV
jgi:hypothetical protein